ncbi:uncharacterized protein K02A2.6-like [Ochlerotatus camptorhynchus]|uniref:uncharacterized protein K02A2.6-like n=1 Tax=Ochlerotatus camptorhynchus TaxID=644619 RepID=UPI0031D752DB
MVRKANGSIRICGDYFTGLNDAPQPHQYPLPLPEDIFIKLTNWKVFSIIDMSKLYLQLEVDESSSKLLAIITLWGIYKVNRLAPGVKAAPGAFQLLVDTMLTGLKHTCGYIDYIVAGGEDEEHHWRNLNALFQRLQEIGFTVRFEKCSFGRQQIQYVGHLLDHHGVRPDPAKIEAIKLMPEPTDVSGVRLFLGAVNFYEKFVPNMRALCYPLDKLLKTESNSLGQRISMRPQSVWERTSVTVFPMVQSKSSNMRREPWHQPSVTTAKRIEVHRMIFGRKILLQTDHQPLLRIFGSKKGIPVYTANRLQRWALTLLMYDFVMQYVATDKFVQQSTKTDAVLKKVYWYFQEGWPNFLASDAD